MSQQKTQGNSPLQELFIGIADLSVQENQRWLQLLGDHTGLPVYYEPVQDNEYLADFYADTAKHKLFPCRYIHLRRPATPRDHLERWGCCTR